MSKLFFIAQNKMPTGLVRNADIIAASAYAGIPTTAVDFGGAQDAYVINIAQQSRIRQSGDITIIEFYAGSKPTQLATFNFTVWRKSGSNYNRIASQNVLSLITTGAGVKSITLPTPITVQEGDYTGFSWTGTATVGLWMTSAETAAPTESYYNLTDPGTTNVNWAALNAGTGYIPIRVKMQAPHVVTIGDSYPSGYSTHRTYVEEEILDNLAISYPYKFQVLKGWVGQNVAILGQNTSQISARFSADVLAAKPLYAIINGGGNDVNQSVSQATFESNWNSMIDACQAAGVIPIVVGIPPFTASTNTQAATIDTWNAALASICTTQGVTFVDLVSTMGEFRAGGTAGNKWNLIAAYDEGDFIHLSDAGAAHVASRLAAVLP